MRAIRALSHPAFPLFVLSAGYLWVRGPAPGRPLLSMLLATSFGVGELITSAIALTRGDRLTTMVPRILNGVGALFLASSMFMADPTIALITGSVVLCAGLLLWTRQLRAQARADGR